MTYSFPDLEPVCRSMSSSNYCFLTCIQISLIIIKVKDGDGLGPGSSGRDGEKRSDFKDIQKVESIECANKYD